MALFKKYTFQNSLAFENNPQALLLWSGSLLLKKYVYVGPEENADRANLTSGMILPWKRALLTISDWEDRVKQCKIEIQVA